MKQIFISSSVEETHLLAKKILKDISTNLICLYGELGAGKTTFVQGLAQALGIKKRILSPSFVLVREYKINVKSQKLKVKNLHHIDCYRINSEQDIKSIDLPEIWSDPANLVVVEWAERVQKILPKKRIDIKFEYIGENKRRITSSPPVPKAGFPQAVRPSFVARRLAGQQNKSSYRLAIILSIDTSDNKKTTVKLDNLEIVEKYEDPRQQRLLQVIEKILKRKKANLKDITQIKVNLGPGSFTGLRVGCAVANALAWSLGIKVNGKKQVEPVYSYKRVQKGRTLKTYGLDCHCKL